MADIWIPQVQIRSQQRLGRQPRNDHGRKKGGLEIADMRTGELFHSKDDPPQRRIEGGCKTLCRPCDDHIPLGYPRPPGWQPFIDLPEYRPRHLDSRPLSPDDTTAKSHDQAGKDLYHHYPQAQQSAHLVIVFGSGQLDGCHHLGNTAAPGIRSPPANYPPGSQKTMDDIGCPFFGQGKQPGIQYRHQPGNKGSYPERNGLQEIMSDLVIADPVKGLFARPTNLC